MSKKTFRYDAKIEEVEVYLEHQGYTIKKIYSKTSPPRYVRFDIIGTTIQVSDDVFRNNRKVGYGLVTLWESLDTEKMDLSKRLYKELSEEFKHA